MCIANIFLITQKGPSKESVGTTAVHQHEHTLHYCTWSLHGNKQGSIRQRGTIQILLSMWPCNHNTFDKQEPQTEVFLLSVKHALDPSAVIMQQSCFVWPPAVRSPCYQRCLKKYYLHHLLALRVIVQLLWWADGEKQPNCWITRLKPETGRGVLRNRLQWNVKRTRGQTAPGGNLELLLTVV